LIRFNENPGCKAGVFVCCGAQNGNLAGKTAYTVCNPCLTAPMFDTFATLLFDRVRRLRGTYTQGETHMDRLQTVKGWIGSLTDIGLMLLALGIVAALLAGPNAPFVGNPVGNIVAMVKDLGSNGLVGLIALGIVLWLFSNRKVA
jgi:hypothetical protein